MVKKRPQLDLDDLYRLKWLLGGLLILLSVSTVLYLEIDAWLLMGLTTLGVSLVMVKPSLPSRIPKLFHTLAFPGIVAIFLGDLYLTAEVLPALVRLDILLILYRGITYRQRRDDLQLIVLGLFLIVLAGVLTVSLLFAVQILAFSACALSFMLAVTLVQGAESETTKANETPGWVHRSRPGLWRRVRAATDARIALLGVGLFGGLVVLSGLLFMAIPRVELQNSLFLERFMTKQARTGFSDRIQFGDVTNIQQDNSVAVSIDVTDPSRIPAQPYWRMVVLDEYRDETFRLSKRLRRESFARERTAANLRGQARARLGAQDYWTFYMESGVSRYLPLAGHFEMLRFRDRQHFRVAESLGVVALRDDPVSMTAYRVEGMQVLAELADPGFREVLKESRANEEEISQLELGVSEGDRQIVEQAVREIVGGASLAPGDFAQRASDWLAQRHVYGLESEIPKGAGDPLVRWLVSTEPGHCELFAGALVLLARAEGIPARVVTGFRGGSWNGFSDNYTLRNSDAHAWCELYDVESGLWLRADPTPGSAVLNQETTLLSAVDTREVDRSWTARFDSLRIFWYRRIVNFDQRSQVETIKAVKEATQNTGERLRAWLDDWGNRVKAWVSQPWDVERLIRSIAGMLFVIVASWVGVILMRKIKRGAWRQRGGRLHPVRIEAGRWLRRFANHSIEGELRNDLERLRYGEERSWPKAELVFRTARKTWRQVRRSKSPSLR